MSSNFITIGNTRIRKSNIKNFGVNTGRVGGSSNLFDGVAGAVFGAVSGKGLASGFSDSLLGKEVEYLYVTTYQNDNYTFSAKEIDIQKALKELEEL